MSQLVNLLAAFLLVIALVALALVLIVFHIRRQQRMAGPMRREDVKATQHHEPGIADDSAESASFYLATIVNQLDHIERINKKQLQDITAIMVESKDWRSLGQQFNALFDKRLTHLRTLTGQHRSALSTEKALYHTTEVYRLSRLLLALYGAFVAQSDVITSVLDDWFRAHQHISATEFTAKINLDCARILLLNLDYAQPPKKIAIKQLDMAEACCRMAGVPEDKQNSTNQSLLAEIALRKARLNK